MMKTRRMRCRLAKILFYLPPRMRIAIRFYRNCGYVPRISNPRSFNEKIQARKLKWKNLLFVICSDKLKVRSFVSERVGEGLLVPLFYAGENPCVGTVRNLIKQHGKVVLKPNNGTHCVYFIDKTVSNAEIEDMIITAREHAAQVQGLRKDESWYKEVSPCIIIEKFLGGEDGQPPMDYKFHVFSRGREKSMILGVDFDRFTNHNRTFYDLDLNILDISDGVLPNLNRELQKPKNFDKMVDVAKGLADGFSYVRVDLYNVNGDLRFGEMTFAHHSGFRPFSRVEDDFRLGALWEEDYRY